MTDALGVILNEHEGREQRRSSAWLVGGLPGRRSQSMGSRLPRRRSWSAIYWERGSLPALGSLTSGMRRGRGNGIPRAAEL